MRYIKQVFLSAILIWSASLWGGDGTLPFGDGTLPFGMEGTVFDANNNSTPLNLTFTDVNISKVNGITATSSHSENFAIIANVNCSRGMDSYSSSGTINYGVRTYRLMKICALDESGKRFRIVYGKNSSGQDIILDGYLETNSSQADIFKGQVRETIETDASGLSFILKTGN